MVLEVNLPIFRLSLLLVLLLIPRGFSSVILAYPSTQTNSYLCYPLSPSIHIQILQTDLHALP